VFRFRDRLGRYLLLFVLMRDQCAIKPLTLSYKETPQDDAEWPLFLRRLGVWRSGIEGDPRKDRPRRGDPLYRASSPIVNLVPCSSRCEP